MESSLLFFTDGKDQYDYLHYDCQALGRYLELLDGFCKEIMGKDFISSYSTFTKSDWDSDLEGIIDRDILPDKPAVFDPEEGIRFFGKISAQILSDTSHYRSVFTFHAAKDFDRVLADIRGIMLFFEQAKSEKRKWYISVIGEG